jgi:hypothetical protein
VCKPGVSVLAAELCWRRPPSVEASDVFLGQLDPGMQLGTVEEWMHIFSGAGLTGTQTAIGPFAITTARGLLSDEGFHAVAVIARMTT